MKNELREKGRGADRAADGRSRHAVLWCLAGRCGDSAEQSNQICLECVGIAVSMLVGVALTLPISSAAICAALGLTGLAGCCAQMVGFAVMSFKENRWGELVSQGIGTPYFRWATLSRTRASGLRLS